ncbi:MAG: hypothetical protein R2883_04765 [Caldisericia bacterium]
MKCRKCSQKSPIPICSECANDQELEIIETIVKIDETIRVDRDRKKVLFEYVFPLTKPMIIAFILFALSIITSNYLNSAILPIVSMVLAVSLFIYSWIIHLPLKSEAIEDYRDMNIRIDQLKKRKEFLLELLKDSSEKWTEAELQVVKSNIFADGVGCYDYDKVEVYLR